MESLDKEFARQESRVNPKSFEPVSVSTMTDIKAVVSRFDPAKNKSQGTIPLTTRLTGSDSEGNQQTYQVTADTKSKSQRDMLIEGLDIIRKRIDAETEAENSEEVLTINGREMKPASLGSGVHSHSWVDPLIKQWMGGRREGIKIYWELADGYRYEYDIYGHKLTRFSNDANESS